MSRGEFWWNSSAFSVTQPREMTTSRTVKRYRSKYRILHFMPHSLCSILKVASGCHTQVSGIFDMHELYGVSEDHSCGTNTEWFLTYFTIWAFIAFIYLSFFIQYLIKGFFHYCSYQCVLSGSNAVLTGM